MAVMPGWPLIVFRVKVAINPIQDHGDQHMRAMVAPYGGHVRLAQLLGGGGL